MASLYRDNVTVLGEFTDACQTSVTLAIANSKQKKGNKY